jgi:hypothetical protein
VSSVTDMSKMFWRASAFDQDIRSWNISQVSHMMCMFSENYNLEFLPDAWLNDGDQDHDHLRDLFSDYDEIYEHYDFDDEYDQYDDQDDDDVYD